MPGCVRSARSDELIKNESAMNRSQAEKPSRIDEKLDFILARRQRPPLQAAATTAAPAAKLSLIYHRTTGGGTLDSCVVYVSVLSPQQTFPHFHTIIILH